MTYPYGNTSSALKSRKEAAHLLGIAPQTLAVWACNRRYDLPFIRIGRRVMYRLADLHAFIERNTVGAEVLQ
jgi:hypothetical protein